MPGITDVLFTMEDSVVEENFGSAKVGPVFVEASYDHVTPRSFWDKRHNSLCEYEKRQEAFHSMEYEDRELIKIRVREALEALYDNIDEWLPMGFKSLTPGNRLTVEFSMLVLDHDKAIANRQTKLAFKVRNAIEELRAELESLEDEEE